MAKRMAYDLLRRQIEQRGGSMIHVRRGYQYGAWIVTLNGKQKTFLSNGSGYPELDRLYVPKAGITRPEHYRDYEHELVPGAIERLIGMLE
jgi:hypothetical protein